MKNLLMLIVVGTFAFSCNTSNKTMVNTTKVNTPPTKTIGLEKLDDSISELDDNLVFHLQRETCRGYCPGYTYTIYESGKVDYYGKRNVERLGNHIAEMDATTLSSLIDLANKIGYKKMDPKYVNENIADIPKWTFRFEEKSILFTENLAPAELNTFCKKIDTTLDNLTWEKID